MDQGRIVAEGSPLELFWSYSTREVLELRFGVRRGRRRRRGPVPDLGDRVEVLPDRLLVYSQDGDEAVAKVN